MYEARSAKASHIIHPVLRVALRIIANLVFPQEDVSRAGKMELEILWCMVTGLKRPHFGAFLASKLLKVSTSDSGPIHCGGIISYLATRLTCAELFESKRPGLEKITQGTNAITSNVLVASSFFRQEGDGSITWLVQGEPHFRVPAGDFSSLQLQQDITQTRWCLPKNTSVNSIPCAPAPIPRAPERPVVDHEDNIPIAPAHSIAPTVGGSTSVAPVETARYFYTRRATQYHDIYMRRFDHLDQVVADIRADVQQLTQTVQQAMQFMQRWPPRS